MRRILRITVAAARPAHAVQPGQDRAGGVVRLANFDDDPFDDLAVGAPGEDVGAPPTPGPSIGAPPRTRAYSASSTSSRAATPTARPCPAGTTGPRTATAGTATPWRTWPSAPPGRPSGGARGAGAATIVYGHQYFVHERLLYQGHGGIGGTPEPGDAFGAAVA